jgi:RNA polymerase sigma-70 factor (ECF subfamily)
MANHICAYDAPAVAEERTTVIVERYLHELAGVSGDAPAEPIIRALLSTAVNRLHLLCGTLLHRNYPRLVRPPRNLQVEEMLSGVVERMMKAMKIVHPQTVRQFFALANQHMRWELNDLARRFDKETQAVELRESAIGALPESSTSRLSPNTLRMLNAIDSLPEDEREVFSLVRVQGMTQLDAAAVLGVAVKTVQRRLNRAILLLAEQLRDMHPGAAMGANLDAGVGADAAGADPGEAIPPPS